MKGIIKYLAYLGMSILVCIEVFIVLNKTTPITIASLVFCSLNLIWVFALLMKSED